MATQAPYTSQDPLVTAIKLYKLFKICFKNIYNCTNPLKYVLQYSNSINPSKYALKCYLSHNYGYRFNKDQLQDHFA